MTLFVKGSETVDICLVGYGTLLYTQSLGATIGQETAQAVQVVPVIVRDYRRLFNLRPDTYKPSLFLTQEPIEAAAMNIEPAPGLHFNALAFPVAPEQLEALDAREAYYDRLIVPLYSFDTQELIGEGHVYMSPLDARWINRDPKTLLPRLRDIVWARTGAYKINQAFGQMYDRTTYMADGKTLVLDFYGERLNNYSEDDLR